MYKKNPKKKLEILIIGKGSIGLKHAKIFKNLGCVVAFYRTNNSNIKSKLVFKEYYDFEKIKNSLFDLIVICNPSSLHVKSLLKFKNFSKNFLIEKPFCTNLKDMRIIKNISKNKNIFSGYMMRFDKRIIEIKKNCRNLKNILFSNFVWRTYLPNWHKYENYRKSYAASPKLGGGVILTCSHEVDLAILLFGKAKLVYCLENKKKLNLKVEESVIIFIDHINGIKSSIIIDFANKQFERKFEVFFKNKKIEYNFKKKYVLVRKKNKVQKLKFSDSMEKIYKRQNNSILNLMKKKNYKVNLSLETEKVLLSALDSLRLKKPVKIL
jgi:predicted dehydrogenase